MVMVIISTKKKKNKQTMNEKWEKMMNDVFCCVIAEKVTRVAIGVPFCRRRLLHLLQPCGGGDESATMVTHLWSGSCNEDDERAWDDGELPHFRIASR